MGQARKHQAIFFGLLTIVIMGALHIALLFFPDEARGYLQETQVQGIWQLSPLLRRHPEWYSPPGAARAAASAAAAAASRFDEL
jgi:hypothetical protein